MSEQQRNLDQFWAQVANAPLVILSDFDFTISAVDVGDLMTDTFAPPSAETVRRFTSGEVGSRVYWLDSMARVDRQAGESLAATVAIDPHFAAFSRWCQSERIPLAVVSDGFGFYIRRILGREGLSHLPVFCNELGEGGTLDFPNANPACDFCGCCKAQVARRVRALGARIAYVGDGVSDLYAAAFSDWVFAKGRLAGFMAENGSPYHELTGFDRVQATLAAELAAYRDGNADRLVRLTPSAGCKF